MIEGTYTFSFLSDLAWNLHEDTVGIQMLNTLGMVDHLFSAD